VIVCKIEAVSDIARMTKKEKAIKVVEQLKTKYPEASCSLRADTPFQLLVAVRLSAQCTDARVNMVTPALFERFPDAQAFSKAQEKEVEELIKSCGLFKTKAKDLVAMGKIVYEEMGGELPNTLDGLLKLPGVGRKTANLICGDVYGLPAIVTDTHCIRISNRLGLVNSKEPRKVEDQLRKLIPPEESNDFCHRIVLFGRDVCKAKNPDCANCTLAEFCSKKI